MPEVIAGSPTTVVDYFRVRLDPSLSQDTDKVLEFVFTDEGNQAGGLHVRRGIAEYIPVSADYYLEADFVLKLDSETWAKLYLSSIGLGKAIGSNKVTLKKDALVKVFAMVDHFQTAKNVTVPSLDDVNHMVW